MVQNGNKYGVLVRKFEGISSRKKPELDARTILISTYKSSTDPLSYLTTIHGHYAMNLT